MNREERKRIARKVIVSAGLPETVKPEEQALTIQQRVDDYTHKYTLMLKEIRIHFPGAMLIREMGKKLMKEHSFFIRTSKIFEILRNEGYLISDKVMLNAPSEKSLKEGLMVCAPSGSHNSGAKYYTPYVTKKGYKFFTPILIQKGNVL